MKLIKLLVTLSLINAVIVIGIAQYISMKQPSGSSATVANTPSPSPVASSPLPSISVNPSSTPQSSVVPKQSTTPKPTVVSQSPKQAGCVVQIDGFSYEITSLRQTHSGGDVFKCGTDMSALFWKKHDQGILQIMQKYKI